MSTLLKVGEQSISTYRNLVQYPVPYASGQITSSYYSGNPNPNATVSYLLNQLDGPTTRTYYQYLEDYARITVPLWGAGTDSDPYYFYPHPVLTRCRVYTTAADFVNRPYLNVVQLVRAYAGVNVRMTSFWYDSLGVSLWSRTGPVHTLGSSEWFTQSTNFTAPPQSILDQLAYVNVGVEIISGMGVSQNYYDVTGFRATPVAQNNFSDFRGTYWDGSTTFLQPSYVSIWDGTPRTTTSTLVITELASLTEQTENAQNFTIDEDVTGLDASALSGGTGQASITIPYKPSTPNYLGLGAEMQDYTLGNFYGRVRGLVQTTEDDTVQVSVDESLALLNAWVVAPPMSGTLSSVLRNYVALADAAVRPFVFEDDVDLLPVNAPGFAGNLYDKIRELLAAYGAELVTIDGTHIVRAPLRDSVVLENFSTSPGVSMNLQETSEFVRVHWYDNAYVTNGEVFPLARNPQETEEEFADPTIYSVGAGEVLSVDIQLRASLLTVNNPFYIAFVPDEEVTGSGVYTAVGSDNLPITPAQWSAGGGRIDVKISAEDPSVITLTITGPDFPDLAPFRLAMSSGSGNYYNALHITGTGVFIRDNYVDLATGALPGATGQEYSIECTNPYISTRSQAYQVGQIIAGRNQQAQGISLEVPTPARTGPSDDAILGLLPGKKFVHADQQWRIESTSTDTSTVTMDGSYALSVADYDHFFTRAGGFSVADFNNLYAGDTITTLNFSLQPLRHRFSEV